VITRRQNLYNSRIFRAVWVNSSIILLEEKLFLYGSNDAGTFEEDIRGLSEEERKELLLNALDDDKYQRLLSRLSPKKPYELPFRNLIVHLKKQFHDNKTLFQRRFEALNFRASPPMTVVEILDRINVLGDNFEFDNFDQFKILLTALALSDHAFHTERTILSKLVSEKESTTFNDICNEICHVYTERTADVMRVEEPHSSEVNAIKQVDKKDKGKNPKHFNNDKISKKSYYTYVCYGCGATNHKRVDCPFKNVECRICNKIGHIACLSKTETEISVVKLQGVLSTGHQHRKFANISINNKMFKMQLDRSGYNYYWNQNLANDWLSKTSTLRFFLCKRIWLPDSNCRIFLRHSGL